MRRLVEGSAFAWHKRPEAAMKLTVTALRNAADVLDELSLIFGVKLTGEGLWCANSIRHEIPFLEADLGLDP